MSDLHLVVDPDPIDYREVNRLLLQAGMLLSPTGYEQRHLSQLARERQSPPALTLELLNALQVIARQ